MSEDKVLDIQGLTIKRDGKEIVKQIDWSIDPGTQWVILGANGSGKTSMLSSLTGYLTPSNGCVRVLGQTYGESDWRALRTRIGLVSSTVRQMIPDYETGLDVVVSGLFGVIDLWGKVKPADKARGMEILRQIECLHLSDRTWQVLSQGERQRILIGRALIQRPKVLILDEPCAGLDPVAREHFLQFIEKMGTGRQSPTLVLVTHHVEEITPVFSHVLLMKEGTVVASGEKKKILSAKILTKAFNAPVSVSYRKGRYLLAVTPSRKIL